MLVHLVDSFFLFFFSVFRNFLLIEQFATDSKLMGLWYTWCVHCAACIVHSMQTFVCMRWRTLHRHAARLRHDVVSALCTGLRCGHKHIKKIKWKRLVKPFLSLSCCTLCVQCAWGQLVRLHRHGHRHRHHAMMNQLRGVCVFFFSSVFFFDSVVVCILSVLPLFGHFYAWTKYYILYLCTYIIPGRGWHRKEK